MEISIEEKKKEAVNRMKIMNIFPETIRQFRIDGKVSISEPPYGAFYWIDEKEELEMIEQFEKTNNALVYLIIRSYTTYGVMDSCFYVSDHAEEWESDRNDLTENTAIAYVINKTMPDCSECGYIGFKPTIAAGLVRVW